MIYAPSEDSFLLAQCVRAYHGKNALEIGVGSGIILEALSDHFDLVAGTDIDHEALRSCHGKTKSLLVCCDAASAFASKPIFELIVSNPPYLPDDEKVVDRTVHGGPAGIEATVHFIKTTIPLLAEGGRILVIISSLADSASFESLVEKEKLKTKVLRELRLFYETLSVIEISR
jgi:release factor glutamine methyltransferase